MTDKDAKEIIVRLDQMVQLLALIVSGTAGELSSRKGHDMAVAKVTEIFGMVKR